MSASPSGARPAYRPLSGFVVRAPLLAAGDYERLATSQDGPRLAWSVPEFRLAVGIASPDLAAALAPAGGIERAAPRARAALQRYVIRACLRPTPFGAFAGVGVGRWSGRTSIRIGPGRRPTRTRPDMGWLTAAARGLSADPLIRPSLRIFANPCALDKNGRFYLADPSTGGTRDGPDVSVRATALVRTVLDLARDGAEWSELARSLLDAAPQATAGRADRLLGQLCEQQFLLPELLPALTADPLGHLTDALTRVPAAAGWRERLRAIGVRCAEVDAAEPAAAAAALPGLRQELTGLAARLTPGGQAGAAATTELDDHAGPGGPGGPAEPLQVDSELPLADNAVSRAVAGDVALAADVLMRLHPAPEADRLAGYRAAFHRQYGDDRRVAVLELLDPRFGLGPPGGTRQPFAGEPGAGAASSRRDVLLQRLLAACLRDGLAELVLSAGDIDRLSGWAPDPERLPSSLELSAFLAASSRAAVDRGDYLLVIGPNLGAGAAGRGLGRFADMLGPQAHGLLREAAAADCPGAVLNAELVYRPVRARAANVAVRPLVRAFEVPVGVAPSLPPDAVIRVDELSVRLRGGRLRLFWERGGREVSLCAGHMLNEAAAPPLCRHLMELAADGAVGLHPFSWGSVAAMPFLPRVRTGRVVLHPAQWRLDLEALGPDAGAGLDALAGQAAFDALLARWRERWRLPARVYLTHADNRLLLDLDDAGHRAQLLGSLRKPGRAAVLQEPLPGPADAWLPGPRGRHIAELVVPLVRDRQPATRSQGGSGPPAVSGAPPGRAPETWPASDRIRAPGSDWLYLVLAGPRGTEDALIAGPLGEVADSLVQRGDADGWFFVRYADTGPQLRLRLHGPPGALTGRALPALMRFGAEAIAAGSRTSVSLQVYERELERYGGPETTGLCERIACADSRAVRRLLAAPAFAADRLEAGVLSLADLLVLLVPDAAGQAALCRDAAGSAPHAGAVFRERSGRLRALIGPLVAPVPGGERPPVASGVTAALADRRVAVAPVVAELRERCGDGGESRWPGCLAPSLLHLHANRLGLDRHDEQLAFGLLGRALRSIRAYPPSGHAQPGEASQPAEYGSR